MQSFCPLLLFSPGTVFSWSCFFRGWDLRRSVSVSISQTVGWCSTTRESFKSWLASWGVGSKEVTNVSSSLRFNNYFLDVAPGFEFLSPPPNHYCPMLLLIQVYIVFISRVVFPLASIFFFAAVAGAVIYIYLYINTSFLGGILALSFK